MRRLFIHIPKNAGMSIRHGLRDRIATATPRMHKSHEYTMAVHNHMKSRGEHDGFEHARWRDLGPNAHKLKAFAIVRNPWDRVVSRYFFSQMVANQGRPPEHANLVTYPKMTFEEFLEERHEWGGEPYYWHRAVRGWYPQRDYVIDETGMLRTAILRFEHLDEDLMGYMGETLPPGRRNVTPDSRPYREMYNRKTINTVAEWYLEDIEMFGFDFDSPATINTWANG